MATQNKQAPHQHHIVACDIVSLHLMFRFCAQFQVTRLLVAHRLALRAITAVGILVILIIIIIIVIIVIIIIIVIVIMVVFNVTAGHPMAAVRDGLLLSLLRWRAQQDPLAFMYANTYKPGPGAPTAAILYNYTNGCGGGKRALIYSFWKGLFILFLPSLSCA
eukprot:COSAG06_NODE_2658_length_6481_cov_157.286901_5_plen_163_part_00